jgi:hypothetical protein
MRGATPHSLITSSWRIASLSGGESLPLAFTVLSINYQILINFQRLLLTGFLAVVQHFKK